MTARQHGIAIIGGGSAGWWLAYALVRRGIRCTVIDTHPFAAYASTRNQGWLHSGAFYAIFGDNQTAYFCQRGYHLMRFFEPSAIHSNVPCFYLFEHEGELEHTLLRCNELGIRAKPIPMQELKDRELILHQTSLAYAAEVWDCPIDTSRLLERVAHEAHVGGAHYRIVPSLDTIIPTWDAGTWRVRLDHGPALRCNAIVLACGTYIPEMLARLIPGQVPDFERTKIPVLVMKGPVANSMLITPYASDGPNLVPFFGEECSGATICLRATDQEIADPSDTALPPDHLQRHLASLSEYYGGLKSILSRGNHITAHFYTCQKLRLRQADLSERRSHILLTHPPVPGAPESIFTFYPGKFTTAPIAAKLCAEQLQNFLADPTRPRAGKLPPPAIARQKYYDPSKYDLIVDQEGLSFRPS